jgi:ABC-2 type transport system ATP-binding protein
MIARLFGQSRRDARSNAVRVLAQFGLSEAADRLVRTYSGGMRRKLDLGASLVGEPRILLLDEPTTGLDPRARIELWDAIRTLVEHGTDVVLTTQYLDEADHLASQIVIIDHGKAIAAGTPTELKQRAGHSVVEVHVRDPQDIVRVAAALAELGDGEPQIDEATRRVSMTVPAGTAQLIAELPSLVAVGPALEDIAVRHPKLDEVFLALTGQSLETPAESPKRRGRGPVGPEKDREPAAVA